MQLLSRCSERTDSKRSEFITIRHYYHDDHAIHRTLSSFIRETCSHFLTISCLSLLFAFTLTSPLPPVLQEYSSSSTFIRWHVLIRSLTCFFVFSLGFCCSCCVSLLHTYIDFYCHGNWKDNETTFTIVSSAENKKQYCLTYTPEVVVSTGSEQNPEADLPNQVLRMEINSGSCPHPNKKSQASSLYPGQSLMPSQILSPSLKRDLLRLNLLDHGKFPGNRFQNFVLLPFLKLKTFFLYNNWDPLTVWDFIMTHCLFTFYVCYPAGKCHSMRTSASAASSSWPLQSHWVLHIAIYSAIFILLKVKPLVWFKLTIHRL